MSGPSKRELIERVEELESALDDVGTALEDSDVDDALEIVNGTLDIEVDAE